VLWSSGCVACALLVDGRRLGRLLRKVATATRSFVTGRESEPDAFELAPGRVLSALAAMAVLYLGSIAIVDTWGVAADGGQIQTGQVLLSAFWALTGFGTLVYGLLRNVPSLRRAGLALLVVAIAKVFTYDLSQLTAIHRVLSLIALGLLLLAGAFAYQRVRLAGARR